MKKNKNQTGYISQLRQDPASGDWIVIATTRKKKLRDLFVKPRERQISPIKNCPFENPQATGHKAPELIKFLPDKKDWFLQIFENKYPALRPENVSVQERKFGPYGVISGRGYHDLLLLHNHKKPLSEYSVREIKAVLAALQERYRKISQDKKNKYISIFHNWGVGAGASLYHPHLQIIAVPVIPPAVQHSLAGALKYYQRHRRCVYCDVLNFELKEKKRVIFQNKNAVLMTPFISKEPFELKIFPRKHSPYFEDEKEVVILDVAEALKFGLGAFKKKLGDPDFNFFIHTAPVAKKKNGRHFHWHIEIIPKISISAGFELSTGIEITTIDPDEGAKFLKG
ncbi:MAG: DUF4921 family protein [bacterium]|nr:DUF4921 family protein [bacterium]